jgi:hypothetical protein
MTPEQMKSQSQCWRLAFLITSNQVIDEKNQTLLRWLSNMSLDTAQQDYLDNWEKRHEGTGKWILRTQEFCDWFEGRNKTLWCRGMRIYPTLAFSQRCSNIADKFQAEQVKQFSCMQLNVITFVRRS